MADLVPAGGWDTHTHVFDPEKFPYAVPRSYTPKAAQISEYPTSISGCKNIVIVQASVQGLSPAPLLDTLAKQSEMNGYTLRGLTTIDPFRITDAELDQLHAAGVRGARLHEMSWGHGKQNSADGIAKKIEALAHRIARLEWAIGVFCPVGAWAAMADMIRGMNPRVKLIADHFGGTFPAEANSPEFATFLDLVREKRLWVKVSGFERLYHGEPTEMKSIESIVKAVIEAGPDRLMFGTDWPHTQLGVTRKGKTDQQRLDDIEGFRTVNDDAHIRQLREWIPSDEIWQKLWVDTPNKLFL